MIEKMIGKMSEFFNKKVSFNTLLPVDSQTKAFKMFEELYEGTVYITTVRVNEYDDKVVVINIDIKSVDSDRFYEMNSWKRKEGVV